MQKIIEISSRKKEWIQYGGVVLKAYVCAFAFTHFLLKPVYVEGRSMTPGIQDGTMGFSNVAARHMSGIERFDVVLLRRANGDIWLKRVIALPHETIEVRDHILYINDQPVQEPYLHKTMITEDFGPVEVGEGEVFVMGDHREVSYDSRNVGCIPLSSIISKDLYPVLTR